MENILTHKVCSKCGELKSAEMFVKDPQKKDGLYSSCKECYKKYYKKTVEKYKPTREKYKVENRDKILAQKHKKYDENRETLLEKLKEYHRTHKESENKYREKNKLYLLQKAKEWAIKNKDRVNARMRKWRAENKDKVSVQKNNRRSREKRGRITNEEWAQVLEKYGNKCLCCGKSNSEARITMDHVLPLDKGGLNVIENVQPLCKSCNSKKHTKHIDYR